MPPYPAIMRLSELRSITDDGNYVVIGTTGKGAETASFTSYMSRGIIAINPKLWPSMERIPFPDPLPLMLFLSCAIRDTPSTP